MDYKNIELLLEKYLNGETTINEEKKLTNYFLSENVATHLIEYQPMFSYYNQQKNLVYSQKIKLKSKQKAVWFSMAAAVTLLFGLGYFYYNNNNQANPEVGLGNCQSPEIAFEQTQKALQMLSSNVNVGINSVAYINEYQNTKNKIFVE